MRRTVRALTAAVALCLGAGAATADEVTFLNGDRLTGKIVSAAKGRLTIRTEAAGNVTIDIASLALKSGNFGSTDFFTKAFSS